jgi:hypothetical protein
MLLRDNEMFLSCEDLPWFKDVPVDLSENSQPNHSKPLQLFLEILPSA